MSLRRIHCILVPDFLATFLQLTFPAGRCDPAPIVDHAVANSSSADASTVVGYTCEYGYTFNGLESPIVYCDGISWSDLPVQCTGRRCNSVLEPDTCVIIVRLGLIS